jgi:acyl-coenzyme A thioesterase PaaI-like protein
VTDSFFRAGSAEHPRAGSAADGGAPDTLEESFTATEACVGPWSTGTMHGGPPSALLVRACERAAGRQDLVALRAGVDFFRPVPVGVVRARARVIRPGRLVTLAEASLSAGDGEVLRARTWLVRHPPDGAPATPDLGPHEDGVRAPEDCPPVMEGWDFGYAKAMEWRSLAGDPEGFGDAAVWCRARMPLVEGEQPSGLQRAVLVADSGNGISAALDWTAWSFVNIDLDVHLSRPVDGDWLLMDARTRYQSTGTGLATSTLRDRRGVVGAGAQTLVIRSRSVG